MFWKFDLHTSSHLDALLEREDLSLPELLDEEDVLQECKVVNRKLLDFLLQPPHLLAMVAWVTQEPPASGEERLRYKYPSVACEILTSDVPQINDALGADESLLNRLYGFLQSDGCLNPLLASFFSKVMGILINRKTDQLVSFLRKKDDFVDLLLQHIGTSAIMDLLLRLLTCVERPQLRQEVVNWLNEEKIVQRLIEQIHPSKDDNQHSNASQSLCDIIRLSRDQMIQVQDSPEPDQLLATLEKQETIEQLLSNMLEGELSPSVLVSGIQVLLTLLEPRRPRSESMTMNNFFSSVDGQLELLTQATLDSTVSNMGTLHALRPRLGRFHQLLLEPPQLEPLCTTWGTLAPPLGNTRLHVVKLLASALNTNDAALTQELLALDVPNTMLDLFFHYVFNNFLHTQVEVCVSAMLSAGPPSDSSLETPAPNPVVKHLLQQCRLVERILTSWEENDRVQSAGGPRKGYMGHLTRVANALVQNTEKGPNAEQLGQLLKELPGEQQEQWEAFVSGALAETNKKNMVDLVNTHHLHSSSDDEDDRLKEFNFPEEAVLQQAFMDFQMQRMTSAFIDHFGFNDEEFGEQEESVNAPFDKTANITFSLNADDENPNANLLEICYKDRIQQFDDEEEEEEEEEGQGSGESDGEDGAWQSGQLARGTRLGQPPCLRSGGSTDSEEEEEEEEEDDEEDDEEDGRVARGGAGPSSYPSPGPQPPGPSWTATFDPVPTNALAGSQDSGDKELCSGPPVSQGPLCMPQDLPASNGAGPAAPNALQLRSQDPTPTSAPQEATDGGKVAEPSAPCRALVSFGDLQATLRGTSSAHKSLDSATRDPTTSVPAPGAYQPPQTVEGEKSPEPLRLPQNQSAQALQLPPMLNTSAPGGPVSPGSQ
ncbi:protein phosphatase 6 regulatory subunit 1 [Rhinolophus ferrumequinum]|uniref:Protein phosphatase 6 regulatory subunit 1 n=2 Tax=Rhinolophus ferrumequinum TaxID=59479 RepID=A0A671FT18_RHIFE|nr:serine/threonine-protein phosphatase 6 regulatory subunit 1 isoform X3 [Rhinolophus ferrumequinum]XP_032985093.1 serine/threonine-protein phosphatase 6 regulatory subunit 1 isoform X3 [Rhinolophus ferrumequinum]KAF6288848.1 protein phosphatase 6 regulatory subunit 1 [Rhinolophus ferrumequinum]